MVSWAGLGDERPLGLNNVDVEENIGNLQSCSALVPFFKKTWDWKSMRFNIGKPD